MDQTMMFATRDKEPTTERRRRRQEHNAKQITTTTTMVAEKQEDSSGGNDHNCTGIRFVDYRNESQLDHVMSLVGRDLSEPYSSESVVDDNNDGQA